MAANQVSREYVALCIAEQIVRTRLSLSQRAGEEIRPLTAVAAALGLREAVLDLIAATDEAATAAWCAGRLADHLEAEHPEVVEELAGLDPAVGAELVKELTRRRVQGLTSA